MVLQPNMNPGKNPQSSQERELLPCHLQSCSCRNTAGPVLCNEKGHKCLRGRVLIYYSETKYLNMSLNFHKVGLNVE